MALQENCPDLETKYFVLPDGTTKELTSDLFDGKYVVIVVFYAAFHDISTEELIYFDKAIDEVDENTEIIGMCRESTFAIVDWMNTIGYNFQNIKIISDLRVDGMVGRFGANGNKGYPNPYTAIIDPNQKIRHICEHTPHIGRSVRETLRILCSLQEVDYHSGGRLAPANYIPGEDWYIKNTKMGVNSYYKDEQYYLQKYQSEEEANQQAEFQETSTSTPRQSINGSMEGSVYETAAGSRSVSGKGSVASSKPASNSDVESHNTLITQLTGMASKMFSGDKKSLNKKL